MVRAVRYRVGVCRYRVGAVRYIVGWVGTGWVQGSTWLGRVGVGTG